MKQMNEDLVAVINRLPEHADVLQKHFLRNTEFQSMCGDYRKCHDALIYWAHLKNKESTGAREEYAALLAELEAEIIQFLDDHPLKIRSGSGPGKVK